MKIIGISGKKQSGKNTVAKMIADLTSLKCEEFAFADSLKQEVAEMCGTYLFTIEENKNLYRPLLQAWGIYKRQTCGADYWIEQVVRKIQSSSCDIALVTDVRFRNELEALRILGARVVRIVTPELSDDQHISETELDNETFHFTIHNSYDLSYLRGKVITYLQTINIPIK
jgi:hypothetical protein